jgi:hypothetical protein
MIAAQERMRSRERPGGAEPLDSSTLPRLTLGLERV